MFHCIIVFTRYLVGLWIWILLRFRFLWKFYVRFRWIAKWRFRCQSIWRAFCRVDVFCFLCFFRLDRGRFLQEFEQVSEYYQCSFLRFAMGVLIRRCFGGGSWSGNNLTGSVKDFFYLLFLLLGLTFPLVWRNRKLEIVEEVFLVWLLRFFLCGLIDGGMESVSFKLALSLS